MKNLAIVITSLSLIAGIIPGARGVGNSHREALPNLDKREKARLRAEVSPEATQAEANLKARVPGLKISRDGMLGTPRWVSSSRGFLTEAGGAGKGGSHQSLQAFPPDDPHRVVKAFVNEHPAVFGHDASLLSASRVSRDSVSPRNQLRTVVWQQTHEEIQIHEAQLIGNISGRGELINVSDRLMIEAAKAANRGNPGSRGAVDSTKVLAGEAVSIAASNIGGEVPAASTTVSKPAKGAEKIQELQAAGLIGPAYVQLVWLPMDADTMRLSWRVILSARPNIERYLLLVDAETGEVLLRRSLNYHASPASFNVFTSDSPSPLTPGWPDPSTVQPTNISRVMMSYPLGALDTNASPAGWIADGDNVTRGNNADAFLDRNLDNSPDIPRPQGDATRTFDYPMDLDTMEPLDYPDASVVQLFWRANWYHDIMYQYGFNEFSGNYQVDNFRRGGLDRDPIRCLTQAGADVGLTDNSMFQPGPDGVPGVCYMFVFTGPRPTRDGSLNQEVVIHELTHGLSDRLLGGGAGISSLQAGGMGEGWSDFYAMALLSELSDDFEAEYPTGG